MSNVRFITFAEKDYFPKSGKALDIGCNKGRESRELLQRGFEVDAIDSVVVPEIEGHNFHFQKIALQDYVIVPEKYNLILAYYILPFLKRKELVIKAINDIRSGLKKDGIAIITLFGNEHEWRDKGHHFFSDLGEAKTLIGEYIDFVEQKGLRKTMEGGQAFWHSWDFVIRK
jgi:SAM-dependent methyltransferase